MPKYSSVQAYTDTNANLQTVSYERATGGKGGGTGGGGGGDGGKSKSGVVKPESVVNPYGSTAGAHSGEFHMYRKTRNREMQRIEALEHADSERTRDEEFHNKLQKEAEQLEKKTSKKRAKRQKSKEAKVRRKNLTQAGIAITTTAASEQQQKDEDIDTDEHEEFPMVPLPTASTLAAAAAAAAAPIGEAKAGDHQSTSKAKVSSTKDSAAAVPPVEFANDGSFLEMAQKKLAPTTEPATTTETKKTLDSNEREEA